MVLDSCPYIHGVSPDQLLVVAIFGPLICLAFVILRFLNRKLQGDAITVDDWLIIPATVPLSPGKNIQVCVDQPLGCFNWNGNMFRHRLEYLPSYHFGFANRDSVYAEVSPSSITVEDFMKSPSLRSGSLVKSVLRWQSPLKLTLTGAF